MEFDQAFAGSGDWNFPSPTATPTQPSFSSNVLHTPKTATFPSHFQDAFNTPQMPSYATPQQPQYSSMTPFRRPQSSSSETLRSNYYANVQAGGSHGMQMSSQSACNPPPVSPMQAYGFQTSPAQPIVPSSFVMGHMQTPPPTRGTSVKRPEQTQIAFGTPSTIASRRFTTPQQYMAVQGDSSQAFQTPMQFPQLNYSPNVYQFANLGPATAPVMPQTQLFWDQTASPQDFTAQNSTNDPFAPALQSGSLWSAISPQQSSGQAIAFDTPAMTSFPVQPVHPRPSSAVQLGSNIPSAQIGPSTSTSLDPSLIYSSPVRPAVRSANKPKKPRSNQDLAVAKRKDSAAPENVRDATVSPTDIVPAVSGPGLRRSHTMGAARPRSAHPSLHTVESVSRSSSVSQCPRSASPLKRAGKPSLGSISERKPRPRASVILTIDETGRARTETTRPDDSPTKSIRERYPGLFDSDSSDDESDTSEQAPSRSASFTFAKGEERRSKAARLDPPVENLEGLELPRSNSSASMRGVPPSRAAKAAVAQLRRHGSLRRTSRISPAKRNVMSNSTGSLIDTCPMELPGELPHTTAVAAQNPISPPKGASQGIRTGVSQDFSKMGLDGHTDIEQTLDAHNRRWNMMSSEQQHPPSTSTHQRLGSNQQHRTMLVRCVCGVTIAQGYMKQCSSCTQWLHASCIGIEPTEAPQDYTCFLCTKPSNGARLISS